MPNWIVLLKTKQKIMGKNVDNHSNKLTKGTRKIKNMSPETHKLERMGRIKWRSEEINSGWLRYKTFEKREQFIYTKFDDPQHFSSNSFNLCLRLPNIQEFQHIMQQFRHYIPNKPKKVYYIHFFSKFL